MLALARHHGARGAHFCAGALCCAFGLWGCAHGPGAPVETGVPAEVTRAQLEQQLETRDRRLRELEGRMALLEAEAREIRDRLVQASPAAGAPLPGLRQTVRIGSHVREQDSSGSDDADSRPVLRLYGEPGPGPAATSAPGSHRAPLPALPTPPAERLPIAPLPTAEVESLAGLPSDSVQAYRAALDLVRKRDFERALSALSAFLVRYPGDPRTADALFWRGEVQFALEDFQGALISFNGALKARLSGERAPDAMLKMGLCHRQLGAPAQARAVLERLKSQFPQSRAAKLVSQEDAS